MTGTICDVCKKFKTQEEEVRPMASNTTFMTLRFHHPIIGSKDFCSYECLLKEIERIHTLGEK